MLFKRIVLIFILALCLGCATPKAPADHRTDLSTTVDVFLSYIEEQVAVVTEQEALLETARMRAEESGKRMEALSKP